MTMPLPATQRQQDRSPIQLVLLLLLAAAPQIASALTFNFSQTGYAGGATVTGSFSGTDLNGDGALSSFNSEITAYSMSFSGNAAVLPFTHTLFDLGLGGTTGLVYKLGAPFLGDDQSPPEGIGSGPLSALPGLSNFAYRTGYGPTGLTDPTTGLSVAFGLVEDVSAPVATLDNAFNFVVVTQVPAPAPLALFSFGLACAGFARWRGHRTSLIHSRR